MVWVFAEIAIVLALVGFAIWWVAMPAAKGREAARKDGEDDPGEPGGQG